MKHWSEVECIYGVIISVMADIGHILWAKRNDLNEKKKKKKKRSKASRHQEYIIEHKKTFFEIKKNPHYDWHRNT